MRDRAGVLLGLMAVVAGSVIPGQAGARSKGAVRCRGTIAAAVRGLATIGLNHFARCEAARPQAADACADLGSTPSFVRETFRGQGVVDYFCGGRQAVLENYPPNGTNGIIGDVAPIVQDRLERNARALLGPLGAGGGPRAVRRCRSAIARARTILATGALRAATACQHKLDRRADEFGIIAPECMLSPAKASNHAARMIGRACAGLTGSDVAACDPLPTCVITAAIELGHAMARDTYGAKADQRGALCGNGEKDIGEDCDHGPANSPNGDCTDKCKQARCGDTLVETGVEDCDNGKDASGRNFNSHTCTAECKAARCGDGIVARGAEECDDGNDVACDGCTDCHFDSYACPAAGTIDVTTTLVPVPGTFSSAPIGGMRIAIGYPDDVSVPGSGFLSVGDPADPTTPVLLLGLNGPGRVVNFYDGLVTFFDKDAAAPESTVVCPQSMASCLDTALTFNHTADVTLTEDIPFILVRAGCAAGRLLRATDFPCQFDNKPDPADNVPKGGLFDQLSRPIPAEQDPACAVTLPAALCVVPTTTSTSTTSTSTSSTTSTTGP